MRSLARKPYSSSKWEQFRFIGLYGVTRPAKSTGAIMGTSGLSFLAEYFGFAQCKIRDCRISESTTHPLGARNNTNIDSMVKYS